MSSEVQTIERRANPRRRCQFKAAYQTGTGELDRIWWWCRALDFSPTGLRLVTGQELSAGTPIALDLSVPNSETSLILRAYAVNTHEEPDGRHIIGFSFRRNLSDEEFHALETAAHAKTGVWIQSE